MVTRAERAAGRKRRGKKPPGWGAQSTKNSHTAPKRIATEKNRARALELREQGLTYEAIARVIGKPESTVHDWVITSLDRMIVEPGIRLLKLELGKLDAIIEQTLAQMPQGRPRCAENIPALS